MQRAVGAICEAVRAAHLRALRADLPRDLQSAGDAADVVGVDAGRGLGIDRRKLVVQPLRLALRDRLLWVEGVVFARLDDSRAGKRLTASRRALFKRVSPNPGYLRQWRAAGGAGPTESSQ